MVIIKVHIFGEKKTGVVILLAGKEQVDMLFLTGKRDCFMTIISELLCYTLLACILLLLNCLGFYL